jgi:hypothetical protein
MFSGTISGLLGIYYVPSYYLLVQYVDPRSVCHLLHERCRGSRWMEVAIYPGRHPRYSLRYLYFLLPTKL